MGHVPVTLARDLRDGLGLTRAVETGTFLGDSAEALAEIFPAVVTVELADSYYTRARERFAGRASVSVIHGDAAIEMASLVGAPTFYWLDGHYATGDTAGIDAQCPLLSELAAIKEGGTDVDCVVIDDARLFFVPHPKLRAADWPSLLEISRLVPPGRYLCVAHDQIVIVPEGAKEIALRFAYSRPWRSWPLPRRAARHLLIRALNALED